MKNFMLKYKKISIKLIILLIFILGLITFIILKQFPDICEYWTNTFVNFHVTLFGWITKYIPFSLTEIFFIFLIIFCITYLILMIINFIKKKKEKGFNSLLNILIPLISTITFYQVTAEMAYNRAPIELKLYEEEVNKDKYREIIEYFMADLSECCDHLEFKENGDMAEPYSLNEMNAIIEQEFIKFNSDYLFSFTTNVKPMLSSFIYREFHITGVTFLPLGEANINTLNVAAGKPFTYIHELAHSKGAMRESDADLIASYITLHSDNYYLRYSGYYNTIGSLMRLAKYTGNEGEYQELVENMDERFLNNLKYNNPYWKSHSAGVNFANWINDIYLKLSGQANGVNDYGDTPITIDKDTNEIIKFSNFQKLYFSIFYEDI